jgi:transcriptional regulator with XRE-family HTH domain
MDFDLRSWRTWAGWSQDELSAVSGLSQATITALENGRQVPGASSVAALAWAFGVTRAELLHMTPAEMWVRGWRPPEHDALLATAGVRDNGKPPE